MRSPFKVVALTGCAALQGYEVTMLTMLTMTQCYNTTRLQCLQCEVTYFTLLYCRVTGALLVGGSMLEIRKTYAIS